MKNNDEINFEKISYLFQALPSDVVFIFKAMHIIGVHNRRSGGTTRDRLMAFTNFSIEAINEHSSNIYINLVKIGYRIKLWLFEHLFWLFNYIYGFKEYAIPIEVN